MTRMLNRYHARRAARGRAGATLTSQPEPRTIGSFARGRQLCAGNFLFAGYLVEAPGLSIWDLPMPDAVFEADLHGFTWLDDLVAVGDLPAQDRAQAWTLDWSHRYGNGTGPGWTPALTGRRLMRWINHALFLLQHSPQTTSDPIFRAMSAQGRFLERRWTAAAPGLPRFEALTGLLYAGLSLSGLEHVVDPAIRALAAECKAQIDTEGGIPSRNPEELLEVFTLLNWCVAALAENGRAPASDHARAIARIAPALRALRHADGGLARFHGGGRGMEGRLDQALAASGSREINTQGLAMGFARLSHGRTTVILDAASPPQGAASVGGHASTLAFELTSGRRALIVNCGSGASFGKSWRRAGRATPSHSTLSLAGYSSSRLAPEGRGDDYLIETPQDVRAEKSQHDGLVEIVAGHDGYAATHGLTHVRVLTLTTDGRDVTGEDRLLAVDTAAERKLAQRLRTPGGVPFQIRFHLHPDVDAKLDLGGTAVSMALKSGELWVFRHDGSADLTLESSVYLERGRLSPRATKQIVLSAAATNMATRIGWSLAKAQDTPISVRDYGRDDDFAEFELKDI